MNNEYKQKNRQLSDTVRLPPGLYMSSTTEALQGLRWKQNRARNTRAQRKLLPHPPPPAFAIYQSEPRMLSASVLLYSILSLSAAAAKKKNRNVNFQRNGRLKPHKILPMFRNTWNVPPHNTMRFHQTQPSSHKKAFLRISSSSNS